MKKYLGYVLLATFCAVGVCLLSPFGIEMTHWLAANADSMLDLNMSGNSLAVEGLHNETADEGLSKMGNPGTLSAETVYDPEESLAIVSTEIYVVFDGKTVVLPDGVVKEFLRPDCVAENSDCLPVLPCVNVEEVKKYTRNRLSEMLAGLPSISQASNANGSNYYRTDDWVVDEDAVVRSIVSGLSQRIEKYRKLACEMNGDGQALRLYLGKNITVWGEKKEAAGTDGTYASLYIEIDDSQQHLYLWENGSVIEDYEVSGFYDEYAVYGVFTIRNKSPNAWSPIAEKWMPWWMAYHYDTRQDAWLGIHELVYWTDKNGIYHEESSDSIGKKKSGGCIRLDRGLAEKLYQRVEVGTPVLIHP